LCDGASVPQIGSVTCSCRKCGGVALANSKCTCDIGYGVRGDGNRLRCCSGTAEAVGNSNRVCSRSSGVDGLRNSASVPQIACCSCGIGSECCCSSTAYTESSRYSRNWIWIYSNARSSRATASIAVGDSYSVSSGGTWCNRDGCGSCSSAPRIRTESGSGIQCCGIVLADRSGAGNAWCGVGIYNNC
jgi:hypothetical protein